MLTWERRDSLSVLELTDLAVTEPVPALGWVLVTTRSQEARQPELLAAPVQPPESAVMASWTPLASPPMWTKLSLPESAPASEGALAPFCPCPCACSLTNRCTAAALDLAEGPCTERSAAWLWPLLPLLRASMSLARVGTSLLVMPMTLPEARSRRFAEEPTTTPAMGDRGSSVIVPGRLEELSGTWAALCRRPATATVMPRGAPPWLAAPADVPPATEPIAATCATCAATLKSLNSVLLCRLVRSAAVSRSSRPACDLEPMMAACTIALLNDPGPLSMARGVPEDSSSDSGVMACSLREAWRHGENKTSVMACAVQGAGRAPSPPPSPAPLQGTHAYAASMHHTSSATGATTLSPQESMQPTLAPAGLSLRRRLR